jgi:methylenetetrahydrofolate--tRNA-(uracil-5-)-methyltransferase
MEIDIVGAGLAGSEAAWQLAERGHKINLIEMRPKYMTPAHQTDYAAEMVCSNSFKSDDPYSATGILKNELQLMNSLILSCAEKTRVPAGNSLAVDRPVFAQKVSLNLRNHPNITWLEDRIDKVDTNKITLIATGPMTADPLADWLANICGSEQLFFYDAIAPIIERDSINYNVAFRASRYNKGGADFINCPINENEYNKFISALLTAPRVAIQSVDVSYFESCLPIEVMADRGRDTLRYGPMKPVGLDDPRTGRYPYAVLQLRQDNLAGDHFNMVGFQTRLTWSSQKEVFRLIPGLEDAQFARLGSIHRNTYVKAPLILDATLAVKQIPNLWIAGQLSGVEGYLESAASGLAAAISIHNYAIGLQSIPFPRETMIGGLLHYIAHASIHDFCPTNAMIGLLPPIPTEDIDIRELKRTGGAKKLKTARNILHRARAISTLEEFLRKLRLNSIDKIL